jgi:hypothetical protein
MHVFRAEMPATIVGHYVGRAVGSEGMRIAFESMRGERLAAAVARNLGPVTS